MIPKWAEGKSQTIIYLANIKKFVRFFAPKKIHYHYSFFELQKRLEEIKVGDDLSLPCVFHFAYELGEAIHHKVDTGSLLAIEIEYTKWSFFSFDRVGKPFSLLFTKGVKFPEYKKKFSRVQKFLKCGDAYQMNLTIPFSFSWKGNLDWYDFAWQLWGKNLATRSPADYAHLTYLEDGFFLLSNSPESLFHIYKRKDSSFLQVRSRPIKGTISCHSTKKAIIDRQWKKLDSSIKDEAELYMITDLIRHDLSLACGQIAHIVHKKVPLVVSQLLHQYSDVKSLVENDRDLWSLINRMFPGGSVTGAPKKRVLDLLAQIEGIERGFYTGSTLIYHRSLRASSINIRTAMVDLENKKLIYQAGGGITLLSNPQDEYSEVLHKVKSFISLLSYVEDFSFAVR